MQIQKICVHNNKYSSSKNQQYNINNPSFGLKLIYDETTIKPFVKAEDLEKIKAVFSVWEKNLVDRFKKVFEEDEGIIRFFSLFKATDIAKWNDIQITSIERNKNKLTVNIKDTRNSDYCSSFGSDYNADKDASDSFMDAMDKALDGYAQEKIYLDFIPECEGRSRVSFCDRNA